MITANLDNCIVQVKYKAIRPLSNLAKIAAIQNGSSIELAEYANITGTVVSLPKKIAAKRENIGFSTKDIQVGDSVIFSWHVIGDMTLTAEYEEPIYKNRVWHKGQEYFICDIKHIYAVIRNNEIIMVNGYVMLQPFLTSTLILPASSKRTKGTVSSEIIAIGNAKEDSQPINAKPGDKAIFNPNIAVRYQINDKPFLILQQQKILGIEQVV